MLRPHSHSDRQPLAESGVSSLVFAGTMLVVIGCVVALLVVAKRNRDRRKTLRDRVERLDQRVGARSENLSENVRERSRKLETRMSSWKNETQRDLDGKLASIKTWQLAHESLHVKMTKAAREDDAKRLTRKDLLAKLAGLEMKLGKRQDAAINLVKGGVSKLQGQVDGQVAQGKKTLRALAMLRSDNKALDKRFRELTAAFSALRNAQSKDRQAAGTQGVKVAADLSKLSGEAAALRKALDAQTRRIIGLEKAVQKAVQAMQKDQKESGDKKQ